MTKHYCDRCDNEINHFYPNYLLTYWDKEGKRSFEKHLEFCNDCSKKIEEFIEQKDQPAPILDELIEIVDDGKKRTSKILTDCEKLFPIWSWRSNKELDENFPPPKKPTARKFKYVQEADEGHQDKSANQCDKEGIQGITLRERLLFEIEYFKREKKHLDVETYTICAGSRYLDGHVPRVDWLGKVRVHYCNPDDHDPAWRARAVVSL